MSDPEPGAPGWFAGLAAGLAVLTGALLVGQPAGVGLTVVAIVLFVAAAVVAGRTDAWSVVWWVAAAALTAVAALRAAGWVVWPAVVSGGALAALAASGGASWWQVGAGLGRLGRADGALAIARPAAAVRPAAPAVRGLALGAALLAVFVPLFATADAAFAHLLEQAMPDDTLDRPVARVAAALALIAIAGALLRAARKGPGPVGPSPTLRLARLEWALPLGALVALFAAFVALQLTALYGGHDHVLETAGLTYAEYAREGFAQLIVAAALTLAVVAGAARWAPRERLLRALLGALCLLTLVILASALTRLGLYEEAYGFTRLRLVAHATILWLGALFVLVLAAGAARRAGWLPRAAVALTGASVLVFALADPDRRIAERNVERYEETGRIDPGVLARLSADAAPALVKLPAPLAACVTRRIRNDVNSPDGLAGANRGRANARAALQGVPAANASCLAPWP